MSEWASWTDTRMSEEELALLKGLIGERLERYSCDEFCFASDTWGHATFVVDGVSYEVLNEQGVVDYFGALEDIPWFRVRVAPDGAEKSMLCDTRWVSTPMDDVIEDVLIYNDIQVVEEQHDRFGFACTSAIVFVFSDCDLVFERDGPFIELIDIYRGPAMRERIAPPDPGHVSSVEYSGAVATCDRTVTSLRTGEVTHREHAEKRA